jgi:uncharacterized membrane protein
VRAFAARRQGNEPGDFRKAGEAVARYLNRAGRLYGDGLRVFYMAFPVVAWLFDATMMLAATAGVLWIRWHLDTSDLPRD